ncbi:MAG: phosphate ABC transporter substrate-binding/OmpA family protein [Myxococcota bacterium]|nr:phosphate ABC transporter substrate-binding/OmpA family protein [Myxococcota bacterium]
MKLTPFGKLFIALVVLGVVGFVVFKRYGDQVKGWAGAGEPRVTEAVTKEDFGGLGPLPDAPRDGKVEVRAATPTLGSGKLNRPLKVAINTWAGHAPGIVANGGMNPGGAASLYKKKYGLDVEFVLLEDPTAKFNAFIAGDIDIMWDTVDSYANEASRLAEQGLSAKAILQEDWSRGGDGIVSLTSIKSIEDLKGKKIATTKFTPSHWLLLYMISQSGLSREDREALEKNLLYFNEAPQAAAAFKAKKVDAAVTWEPDLSGAVAAREGEAHILVSTQDATHVIADTLVARQEIVEKYPASLQAFVAGWFDAISVMKEDPQGTNAIVGDALKLAEEDVSGMLSGLKLTAFADNAQFFGLSGPKPYFASIFDSAFRIWRKKGVVSKAVDSKDWMDSRFVAALADQYKDQKVADSFAFAGKPKATDRAIVNKSLSIHFTTGSDEIMPGSYFTLDSLGDTMLAFGNTYLQVEGNTDSRGGAQTNLTLSQKRAESVKKYLIQNFQLPEERFVAVGKGASNPVASNTTEDGRALNRRTDIKVVLNTPQP